MSENEKTCVGFEEDLVAYVDGELSDERAGEVVAHLKDCPECQKTVDDLNALGEQLKGWSSQEPRPEWEQAAEVLIRERAEQNAKTRAPVKETTGFFSFLLSPTFVLAGASCLLLVVAGWALFGNNFRKMFSTSANALSGDDYAVSYREARKSKSMKDFGERSRPAGTSGYRPADRPSGNRYEMSKRVDRGSSVGSTAGRPDSWGGSGYGGSVRVPGSVQREGELAFSNDPARPRGTSTSGSQLLSAGSARDYPAAYEAPPPPGADRDGTYESNYQAGAGERERVEKLIASGVLVDGQKLKLGAFTRNYHQKFKVPGRRALALNAGLDHSSVLTSGGEVFLQIGIQASKREMSRRPPLNIALVIDRSGSMSEGNKMEAAKQAAIRFISDLRSDDNAVVIAYDDQIEMVGSADTKRDKQTLRRFVSSLGPRGSTNIHGALDAAYREVARNSRPGLISTVLLLSDGLPTAGNTSSDDIVELAHAAAEHGISTTTIGMGLDYNDTLMMGAARRGQGHYHFVKDGSSVEPIFRAEFESLNRVVARALRMRIKLADDVVLKRVLGSRALSNQEVAAVRREERNIDDKLYQELGIKADREKVKDDGIKMMIPYFFSGDSHVVILQLWVPPGTGTKRLAEVTLKYKDLLFNRNGMDERNANATYVSSNDEVVASISKPIKKNLLGYRASEALLTASELVSSGQASRAARMVDDQVALFSAAGKTWGDRDLMRDAKLLTQYRDVILTLDSPRLARNSDLRSYLAKTMSHSAYRLVQ